MWIFTSDSFVSIVQDREHPSQLLVRARRQGDIERFLAPAIDDQAKIAVFTDDQADYKFRAFVRRNIVGNAIADHVRDLHYDNFKNSIRDDELHGAASRVWSVMYSLQSGPGRSWFLPPVADELDIAVDDFEAVELVSDQEEIDALFEEKYGEGEGFYIVFAKWLNQVSTDADVIFWAEEGEGWTSDLNKAGVYTLEQIEANPGYYNDGEGNFAVPVSGLNDLAQVDDGVRTVKNTMGARTLLRARAYNPEPEFAGIDLAAPGTEESVRLGEVKPQEDDGYPD